MDINLFKNTTAGRLAKAPEGYFAFIPAPLPPEFKWSAGMGSLISQASYAFGQLAATAEHLPECKLLVPAFLRREAVFSCKIKGRLTSMSDLFLCETTGMEIYKDVKESVSYTQALEQGRAISMEKGFNFQLLRELHKTLSQDAAAIINPGEFRGKQTWTGLPASTIDAASYVPPPADELKTAMAQFEDFLTSEKSMPALIKAAFLLYQLEAVRPFAARNGKLARIFIVLFLSNAAGLPSPLFGISPFLAKYRDEYQSAFLNACRQGAWQTWVEFFLRAASDQAQNAVQRAHSLLALRRDMLKKIADAPPTTEKLLDFLFARPVINVNSAAQALDLTFPAISKAMRGLETAGIIAEFTGNKRNKIYAAEDILKLLEKE
ncbi:MAG: Fic family protein [Planctomycetes bacterium]|nr:Fic family protein [Planctomycetota bacterium]